MTTTEIGHWHRDDPSTSVAAAIDNYPRVGSQRHAVLMAVAQAAGTADELADRLGWRSAASGNSAAKRLSELKQHGLVAATGERRRTIMGSMAEEYGLTKAGADAIARELMGA